MTTLAQMGAAAKTSAARLAVAGTNAKNHALLAMADALLRETAAILAANARDVAAAKDAGIKPALLDRLTLTDVRIAGMANGIRAIAALPDPVGEVLDGSLRPNGLQIRKVRTPLGVIGIIYEARPNVTADAAALCVKAGNAVVLRGGKEAIHSNTAIAAVLAEAAKPYLPDGWIQMVQDTTRASAEEMMRMNRYIDVLIPRGGAGLIRAVVENSTVPVIETGAGICSVYVDAAADIDMAAAIIVNAKTTRPSVCNAAETLLVHAKIAPVALPVMAQRLIEKNVELRCCPKSMQILKEMPVKPACADDFDTEFGDLILAVKVVGSLDEAATHIAAHGSGHSEAIVTESITAADTFTAGIDAAAVYVNASTRYTDGGEFGLGAEIGISTQKLHARGPMGLREMTTTKYIITGNGQCR